MLEQHSTGQIFTITNAYSPSSDGDKLDFIQELRNLHALINHPWLLLGDFNLVRWYIDRSADLRSYNLMCAFNDLIRDMGVIDVNLENRAYTWSSKRPSPTFSKIDRIFISTHWTLACPNINLKALEMVVSDHVPLLLTCAGHASRPARYKFENFWLKYNQVRDLVIVIWGDSQVRTEEVGGLTYTFQEKAMQMHHRLRNWHRSNFGDAQKELLGCKETIAGLDKMEEQRNLNPCEYKMRQKARERAYELANIIEERWRQRSRCKWLQCGDKNTHFFHSYASARLRRNIVLSVLDQGAQVTDPPNIMAVFLNHMQEVLGRTEPITPFNPANLYQPLTELSTLQIPFTQEEIFIAVRQLASNKASGPDGLTNEFIKEYWDTIKNDVMQILLGFTGD